MWITHGSQTLWLLPTGVHSLRPLWFGTRLEMSPRHSQQAGSDHQHHRSLALLPTGIATECLSSVPSIRDKNEAQRSHVTLLRPPSCSFTPELVLRFVLTCWDEEELAPSPESCPEGEYHL